MGWGFPTGVEAEATSKLWGVDRRQSVPAPLVHIPQWGVSQAEPRRDRAGLNFQIVSEKAEPTTRDARKKGEYCGIVSEMASGEKKGLGEPRKDGSIVCRDPILPIWAWPGGRTETGPEANIHSA